MHEIDFRAHFLAAFLSACETDFRQGDKWSLMKAVYVSACEGAPMPPWAAAGIKAAYIAASRAEVRSWDELLGAPVEKGQHLEAVRKKARLMMPVVMRVREILHSEPRTPIDQALFERVGGEFHICKTLASEYYYEAVGLGL